MEQKYGEDKIMNIDDSIITTAKLLLYESNKEHVLSAISKERNSYILHIFAYNYNWDDGFELPRALLENGFCELATALMIFYLADGYTYITEKADNHKCSEWSDFMKKLYTDITTGRYKTGNIAFSAPLTKIQIYKLAKLLDEQEHIFISNIEGENMEIEIQILF